MNIYKILRNLLEKILIENFPSSFNLSNLKNFNFTIEKTKNINYGHFSSNICILLAKELKFSPIQIGKIFQDKITHKYIEKIEIINNFINFNLSANFFFDILNNILINKDKYGFLEIINKKEKINLEFVSCNPTGPLHIGHMRGAIIGNSIANLLIKAGFDVTKEYFVNDYGAQVIILGKSILYNAIDIILLKNNTLINNHQIKTYKPLDFYPGSYLLQISQEIANEFKQEILNFIEQFINHHSIEYIANEEFSKYLDEKYNELKCFEKIKSKGIAKMLEYIKEDLAKLNIKHDIFFSELQMNENNEVKNILELLKQNKLVENIKLEKPLGIDTDNYKEEFNCVFRSDLYEDDQPRVVQKVNGEITYFASDLAYIANKINRGFNKLIYIFGYDHIGYVKRMQAGVAAISNIMKKTDTKAEFKVYQMVNYLENGQLLKMSKRSGKFETVGDVINSICNYNNPNKNIISDLNVNNHSNVNNQNIINTNNNVNINNKNTVNTNNNHISVKDQINSNNNNAHLLRQYESNSSNIDNDNYNHIINEVAQFVDNELKINNTNSNNINLNDIKNNKFNLNLDDEYKVYANMYAKNTLKFIMLSVKDSTILNFDVEKAKEFSSDNIFFYIQYAYARINSVYANIKQNHQDIYKLIQQGIFNWNILNLEVEKNLIIFLSLWPYIIEQTIETLDLSKIVKFLEDLAKLIHNLWSCMIDDEQYRIISSNNAKTLNRVGLLLCARNIITSGAEILGIELSERLSKI